jgi:tRNA (mo5U34)-methyltransferase
MDYTSSSFKSLPLADHKKIAEHHAYVEQRVLSPKKGILSLRTKTEQFKHLKTNHLDLHSDIVTIGDHQEISEPDRTELHRILKSLQPWRKGPFNIFGIDIDAEWQSNRKWNRLLPHLPDLQGKVIADVGSNNGYYMFRMAAYNPKLVVGFEPYFHHFFVFNMLRRFSGLKNLDMELLGVEEMGLFGPSFDVVFLMGILYHRISPLECLKEVKKAMTPGGTIIVESQAIPGDEPVALFPEKRYAKVPGTYFVPTGTCLKNWMLRAGFTDVELFCSHKMSSKEQRKTEWMEFESYSDFIDPHDQTKTIEGYPAPLRIFLKGVNPLP